MKRIVSLWLPYLPLNRLWREVRHKKLASWSLSDDRDSLEKCVSDERVAFALVSKEKNGFTIFACNRAAEQGGVMTGMKLTDARALLPSLITRTAEPDKDALALRRLADWCQRYTPITALDGADALMLDITGAAHLLGGESNLLNDLEARLGTLGFQCHLGLASTPGAAFALARFSSCRSIKPGEDACDRLSSLPIEALRLDDASFRLLKRFGLKRVGHVFDMPRHSLARRFNSKEVSAAVVKRLDQLVGVIQEPLIPLVPVAAYYERLSFAEPILQTEGFYGALDTLLARLCGALEKDLKGACALTFSAYRADGGVSHVSIQTARPSRDENHFAHLFKEKVQSINPGFGVDVLVLSATVTAPLGERQTALGRANKHQRLTLSTLFDRLSNRLGPHAVTRRIPFESHLPERSERAVTPFSSDGWFASAVPPRPLRLLDVPEPIEVMAEVPDGPPRMFRWRRVMRRIVKASGPERIAPEWWCDLKSRPRTRDYYMLEDDSGRRYWLYREGLYGSDDVRPPQWHMHGLFS